MKKNLFKLSTLALAFLLAAAVPAKPASASFTFGSSAQEEAPAAQEAPAQEEAEVPAAEEETETVTEEAKAPAEEAAQTEAAEEAPAAQEETEAVTEDTEAPAEEAAETKAAPAAAAEAAPAGFSEAFETLIPKFEEILESASKWSKKKAPQTLADFPVLPDDYQGVYAWMGGKTATFTVTDSAYTVETEAPAFLNVQDQATAYFKDMSTLPLTRTSETFFSADKAGAAAHEAADFWRVDLSAQPYSLKTDSILWDVNAGLSIASSGLFGPAGSTDEIRFEVHRSGEIHQSIVWYLRNGELTVDIYYGNGNEVCRELTYDIQTGKLVSSEEW